MQSGRRAAGDAEVCLPLGGKIAGGTLRRPYLEWCALRPRAAGGQPAKTPKEGLRTSRLVEGPPPFPVPGR